MGRENWLKPHLVRWDTICSPVAHGGLGVRKLRAFNQALLEKWLWRYGLEWNRLGRRVLVAKYGSSDGGWYSNNVYGPHGYGLWKGIMMGWDKYAQSLGFQVGRGDRIRFWHDCWYGDTPLKEAFPVLFDCASNRDATIDSILIHRILLGGLFDIHSIYHAIQDPPRGFGIHWVLSKTVVDLLFGWHNMLGRCGVNAIIAFFRDVAKPKSFSRMLYLGLI
uniref:Reverse transcriptase zinc-binding domain-containing protein n=1 Tax=Fagus sylvatica TaxID=28930 RepID=A0A2N9EV50_FAGSY